MALESNDIARRLARADHHPLALTRRRFLQAAAALTGGAMAAEVLPGGLRRAWAQPLGATDGVLVLVNLQGGNDALNTLVPYANGRYHDLRGPVAIAPGAVLALDGEVGLHPSLAYTKSRWDAGQLALVQGVGDTDPDLSHFTSMARWMSGTQSDAPATGWLGRFLDQLAAHPDAFAAVTIGSDVPLTVLGATRMATALGTSAGAFGASTDANDRLLFDAVRAFAGAANSRGAWADEVARAQRTMVDVNATVAPLYEAPLADGHPLADLDLAARLVNADLGIRVVNVTVGGYDTHATQLGYHATLLADLDAGLARFFATLDPRFARRVTVLVVSEFGREPASNDSGGTDHGTAGVHLLIGDRVRGGRYGALPSLDHLVHWGRLETTVDQRCVFASVLARWLGADDQALLGARFEHLDLFVGGPVSADASDGGGGGDGGAGGGGAGASLGRIVPVVPARLLDTRDGTGASAAAPVGPGGVVDLLVAGRGGVPASGATCAVLNATVVDPSAAGYLTVWPAGEPRPLASNLNFAPHHTVPNLVVAKLGIDGRVSLFNSTGASHLVVDVVAYAGDGPGSTYVPLTPTRLLDTRAAGGPLDPGAPRLAAVAGSAGVPPDATGVIVNLTVTEPVAAGYLTAWPAGEPRPLASNLNFERGQTVPNLVLSKLGGGGVLLYSSVPAHAVVDVVGYLTSAATGTSLHPLSPARLLDTRDGTGGGARLGPTATLDLEVTGRGGVPASASAVVLNVTATEPTAPGYVSVWPAGEARPTASSLNVAPGQTVANLVVARLGAAGRVSFFNSNGTTHLVADVVGWFG